MDPQVLLVGVAVFVISAALVYLILKQKPFEEVVAEQNERNEEERMKGTQKKDLNKNLRKPKEQPKRKTAPVQASRSEPRVKAHKMVNLKTDAEIIKPLDEPLEAKPKTRNTNTSRSILINKNEEPVISDHPRQFKHTGPPPKDDLEMKHEHDKMEKAKQQKHEPSKAKKEGKQKLL